MNFPYDIIKFFIGQNNDPSGVPDLSILKPMIVGFPALIVIVAIGALISLEWVKKMWYTWKPLLYPAFSSFFFVWAVVFRVYRLGWYATYLWFAPAVAVMILSVGIKYELKAPKAYIRACLLGGPIAAFMISNYMAVRLTGEPVYIGYRASLVLGILAFDFLLCGIIGLIGHHFRRTS